MENRSKWSKMTDKNLKAMGAGERTSKKVSTIRKADGTSFRRKNANQYGAAEGGNDYTEKRVNKTDRFDLGGTADSSENGGANIGGTLGSSMMKKGGNLIGKQKNLDLNKNGKLDSEDFKMIRANKKANGGGLADVPESFPETDAMSYGKGGAMKKKFGLGGRVKNIDDAIATSDLKDELRSKMKKGDDVIHFAYTDYGGDFMDKVAIEYFEENYPKNTLSETTAYFGKNAFVFGKPATEWIESTKNYPLGFEDFESYYYEKQNEQENKDFERFLDDLKRDGYEVSDEAIEWLNENKSGYYGMTTQGLDFSYSDLENELKEEGLISKDEMALGGSTKGFEYSIGGL